MASRYSPPTEDQLAFALAEFEERKTFAEQRDLVLTFDAQSKEWVAAKPDDRRSMNLTVYVDAMLDGYEAKKRRARFDDPPTDQEMAELNQAVKRWHDNDYVVFERSRPTFRVYSRDFLGSRDVTDWAMRKLDQLRNNRTPLFLQTKVDEFETEMYVSGAYNAGGSDAEWVRQFVEMLKTDYPEAFPE